MQSFFYRTPRIAFPDGDICVNTPRHFMKAFTGQLQFHVQTCVPWHIEAGTLVKTKIETICNLSIKKAFPIKDS